MSEVSVGNIENSENAPVVEGARSNDRTASIGQIGDKPLEPEIQSAVIAHIISGELLYTSQSPVYTGEYQDEEMVGNNMTKLKVPNTCIMRLKKAKCTRWSPLLFSSLILTADFLSVNQRASRRWRLQFNNGGSTCSCKKKA